jgi:hypothetical protein
VVPKLASDTLLINSVVTVDSDQGVVANIAHHLVRTKVVYNPIINTFCNDSIVTTACTDYVI